jgi:hypothetical protein
VRCRGAKSLYIFVITQTCREHMKKLEVVRSCAVAVSVDHPPAWRDTNGIIVSRAHFFSNVGSNGYGRLVRVLGVMLEREEFIRLTHVCHFYVPRGSRYKRTRGKWIRELCAVPWREECMHFLNYANLLGAWEKNVRGGTFKCRGGGVSSPLA